MIHAYKSGNDLSDASFVGLGSRGVRLLSFLY